SPHMTTMVSPAALGTSRTCQLCRQPRQIGASIGTLLESPKLYQSSTSSERCNGTLDRLLAPASGPATQRAFGDDPSSRSTAASNTGSKPLQRWPPCTR